jgi:branched-chain amino acid transport system substrate-binding protein
MRLRLRCLLRFAPLVAVCACGRELVIRVGVVGNADAIAGARFAAAEINRQHGIGGRALALRVVGDGASIQASRALAAADTLSADRSVLAVVGHSNSSASLAGSQVYNARHVVQIAPTSSAPVLSNAGPYTYRLVASDVHQARFLAQQLSATGRKPRTAVLFVNDDYGRSLFHELQLQLRREGVRVVFDSPYTEDAPMPDVESIARGIAAAGAEYLVWLGRARQLQQLLPRVRRVAPDLAVLASDGVNSRDAEQNVGGVFTGVRFVCFLDIGDSRAELVALREAYRRRTGREITADMVLAYDAVMLIAAGARERGPSREGIRRYLESLRSGRRSFPGAAAEITFDVDGDPPPSYCLAEVTPQGVRVVARSSIEP